MDQAAASPSCPRCGAECPAGAAHCPACGFTLIDGGERRPSGGAERPPSGGGSGLPWVVALAAAIAAVAAVFVMLFAGGGEGFPAAGPARTGPPAAVPALEAERRLELRFGGESDDETAAVRCPYRIEPRQMVRCELRYADGIARAMLVRLTPSGELEAAIPYPATLRRSSQSHGD